jgi:hypothetical protein
MTRWLLSPVLVLSLAAVAAACPFCTAVKPSLSERIAGSRQAALVEITNDTPEQLRCEVAKQLLTDSTAAAAKPWSTGRQFTLPKRVVMGTSKLGQLALLMAIGGDDAAKTTWEVIPLDEVSFAYLARAPARRQPTSERLPYYARFLESANRMVAEDAYYEFGAAPFDEVAQIAHLLPMAKMRQWVADPAVAESRRGFYGLALGLAKSDADRPANEGVLTRLVDARADDFRAGFDGILGGYLLLTGAEGIKHLDKRWLSNPQAPIGDLRHAATALRFMHEFGTDVVPAPEIARAMRSFLTRPELAAAAIVDLARWQDWDACAEVAALFDQKPFADAATTRAIVGYLSACPLPAAAQALTHLREQDPQRVAEAEKVGPLTPALR